MDFEKLLREAIDKARQTAQRASDDLYRYSSEVAEAVDRVTGGFGKLELVPVNSPNKTEVAYQLLLRKVGSESPASDLGVYVPAEAGYPIRRWVNRASWETEHDRPGDTFLNPPAVEGHFKWLTSNPNSRLVILVAFLQQQQAQAAGAAGS
jgi:hypothetical protein